MKKVWLAPVVCGVGFVVIILTLVAMNRSLMEKKDAEIGIIIDATGPAFDYDAWYNKQLLYNQIQLANPGLTEDELLALPSVQELLLDDTVVTLSQQEEDEYIPAKMPSVELSVVDNADVSMSRVEDLVGFLKYRNNADVNWEALVNELPGFLALHEVVPDYLNNDIVRFSTYLVNDSLMMIALIRTDEVVETRLFLSQLNDGLNGVQEIAILPNTIFIDVQALDTCLVVSVSDRYIDQGAVMLFMVHGRGLELTSTLQLSRAATLFKNGNLITVSSDGKIYDFSVGAGDLITLTARNGEKLIGISYD